jgi:hypothetical protein
VGSLARDLVLQKKQKETEMSGKIGCLVVIALVALVGVAIIAYQNGQFVTEASNGDLLRSPDKLNDESVSMFRGIIIGGFIVVVASLFFIFRGRKGGKGR